MKTKKTSLLLLLTSVLCFGSASAQEANPSIAPPREILTANKLLAWETMEEKIYLSWMPTDRYCMRTDPPVERLQTDTLLHAWRGERISVEAVVFSPVYWRNIKVSLVDKDKKGGKGMAQNAKASFLRYVTTDDFRTCGKHPDSFPPYEVPDVVSHDDTSPLSAREVCPVWVSIEVPRTTEAGVYHLELHVSDAAQDAPFEVLSLAVEVKDWTLPTPSEQEFHVDFWQQPYSVSRYYGCTRWSDRHFELLKPYMQMLARAGQKVVSTFLFYEPWGDQSYDKFSALVEVSRKKDDSWSYDFSRFDHWVSFMADCGIDRQINCFSMIPWDMTFEYFDEEKGKYVRLKTNTKSDEYHDLWKNFLQAFERHLDDKGWLEKTYIAMDERGLDAMLDAYEIVQEAAPRLKMALAGNYHQELVDKVADYCIALGQHFTEDEIHARRAKGWKQTFYTCCAQELPGLFTNSMPAEAAYLPLYAVANNFDGYLHWSWMNWGKDPLQDSRFRLFPPGDTFLVYPEAQSSVRWERFLEGVQQAEKILLLRKQLKEKGKQKELNELESALNTFRTDDIKKDDIIPRIRTHYNFLGNF